MNAGNPIKPPDEDIESGSSPDYDEDMDRRVTRLEVVIETVLPTLVTKTDLAALLAEVTAEFVRQIHSVQRWMLTIAVALFLGLSGMALALASLLRHW